MDGRAVFERGKLLQFRVGEELVRELAPRVESQREAVLSPSLMVQRDVMRYYDLIEGAIAELKSEDGELMFTDDELELIGEVLKRGTGSPKVLWAEVLEERDMDPELLPNGDDMKELGDRIRALSTGGRYALVDYIERREGREDESN